MNSVATQQRKANDTLIPQTDEGKQNSVDLRSIGSQIYAASFRSFCF